MAENTEMAQARLPARAFMSQMAHTVFSGEPDETLFDALASDACRETLHGLAAECAGVAPLATLCDGVAESAETRAAEFERSVSDCNRAIIGLGANRASHPWESAYTNNRGLLFHEETLEVRNAYRAFGYIPEMYPKVADDHIALECAFMAALANGAVSAYAADCDEELDRLLGGLHCFTRDHLLKWLPAYAADLEKDAAGGLYAAAAAALAAFAAHDEAILAAGRAERGAA